MIMISTNTVRRVMVSALAAYVVVACVALVASNTALLG
jgi:hypothetical protein